MILSQLGPLSYHKSHESRQNSGTSWKVPPDDSTTLSLLSTPALLLLLPIVYENSRRVFMTDDWDD